METTIDGAGRIVIPKALREAMGLTAGARLDVVFTDGRLEIETPAGRFERETSRGLPVLRSVEPTEPMSETVVRDTLEQVRR